MRLFPFSALLAFALVLGSCSDSSTGTTLDELGMTAKVDGHVHDMSSVSSGYNAPKYFVSGSTELMPPNENITIELDNVTAPGTFTIAPGNNDVRASYEKRSASSGGGQEYTATSGTIVVTEIDAQHAKGTFTFSATLVGGSAVVNVTEGTFSTQKF